MFDKKNLFFISKYSKPVIDSKCDAILSPEFYWVIEKELPVKYLYQARKFSNVVFEGLLPEGNYSFLTVKKDEKFLFFAYDSSFIKSKLEEYQIDIQYIDNFYFAQNEFDMSECYDLGEAILTNQNSILSLIPKKFVKVESCKRISNITLEIKSGIKVPIEKYNLPLSQKVLNYLIILGMLFISTQITEVYILKKQLDNIANNKAKLYKKYKFPSTSFQVEAIKNRIQKQNNQQVNFRSTLLKLINAQTGDKTIKKFTIGKDTVDLEIVIKDNNQAEDIKKSLAKSFSIISAKVKDKLFFLELAYD